jgi:N-acyl-D-amino-acid deacylase
MYRLWLSIVILVLPCGALAEQPSERYDILITGGKVVDGTGAPWHYADVAVRDGKIAAVGRIPREAAERVIDAKGLVVAPGFVDMMGQTATPLLDGPEAALNLLSQGITTINAGEGVSAAPIGGQDADRSRWRGMAEYFLVLEQRGLPINVAQTVGHTQVRTIVLGEANRAPSPEELEAMKSLVREAMEAGAIGLSTALIYPPAVYASTEEIAALAAVAGEYGGGYYTHMRNEGDTLLEAIDEALAIGRQANTPVHIFHLKTAGKQNWQKMEQAIARIRAARSQGQQVAADIYPYINNGLGMPAFVHPRHFEEGFARFRDRLADPELRAEIRQEMETGEGWENWYRHVGGDWGKVIVGDPRDARYANLNGKSVAEIASARGEDLWDTFFALVASDAFVLPQSMSEANKVRALREDFISFCTDVGPAAGSQIASHPRAYGAFPRLFARYVREQGAISMERAVAQASALAANEVRAFDRGRIAVGLAADLIVFDPEKFIDRATFEQPAALSEGMRFVLVNGQSVFEDGRVTGALPGRVLRGPGYRKDLAPPSLISGQGSDRTKPIDELMTKFLDRHRAFGASLAITDGGRLVYARGFGYADVQRREAVTPQSLFRIASISKPITAVAVLKLVEQGKLSLDDKVNEIVTAEPHLAPGASVDPRQNEITIRHLLQHRGGWDREVSFDAMFQSVRFAEMLGVPAPAGPQEVIRCMKGLPLDFAPGERYAYSNYGYCLLGRVIEARSGQPYESYVREHVLAPLGISGMVLGKTRPDGRQPGEVRYYDTGVYRSVFADDRGAEVAEPYGAWCVEAMDAHGGWLASAVDLARFACAFDRPESCPILKAETVRLMFADRGAPSETTENGKKVTRQYALGWQVRDIEGAVEARHTGSLPGTSTILIRRADGKNIAVLFNSRHSALAPRLSGAIDQELSPLLDSFADWPEGNSFEASAR